MPVEAVTMETATPFDRLRLALVGKQKGGKSRTAATARKPVLFFDFDKRRESIAGLKDVYALTFVDPLPPMQPDGFSNALTVLSMIEQKATLKTIGEKFGQQGWPDVRPKTVVNDSLDTMSKSARDYAMFTNKDLRRILNVGGTQVFMTNGWDTWGAEMNMVESLILRELGIPELDVIVIFHETPEEAPGSTNEKPQYTGKVDVYPGRYRGLLKYFNEVWRVSREQGNIPTMQVLPDYRFTAASNLDFSKIPANEMRPDISYLIERTVGKRP